MPIRPRSLAIFGGVAAVAIAVPTAAFATFGASKTNPGNTVAAGSISAPTGQTAAAHGGSSITVSWTDPTQSLGTGVVYDVLDSTNGSTPCTNLASSTTTCTETGLSSNTPFTYSVVAHILATRTSWTKSSGPTSATTFAADGSGTLTTPTSSVTAGSTGNTIAFTYTAAAGGISGGAVTIGVPSGWTAPVTTAAIGCTSATVGSVSASGSTITVSNLTLAAGAKTVITYGATSGGSCTTGDGAKATTTTGAQTWQGQEKSSGTDSFANITPSPSIAVNTAASVTVTLVTRNGNSQNYAVTGGVTGGGAVTVTIFSSYNVTTCTAGPVVGTQTTAIAGGTYTSGTQSLTPGTIYFVQAVEGSPGAATSAVYTFAAPMAQGGSATPTTTGC
jgi:hypothetical protein